MSILSDHADVFDFRWPGLPGSTLRRKAKRSIRKALSRCTFDFHRVAPSLNGKRVVVKWDSLAALGEYDNSIPSITMNTRALRERRASFTAKTFLMECAHVVDIEYLTFEQRRAYIAAYHGGEDTFGGGTWTDHGHAWFDNQYYQSMGESFMVGFVRAYSDFVVDDPFVHKSTPEVVTRIREIIG